MLPLPTRFAGIILAFAPLFVHRSWRHARLLAPCPAPGAMPGSWRHARLLAPCPAPGAMPGSWRHARLLLIGALLVPGQRTVTNVLRITGHTRDRHFVN